MRGHAWESRKAVRWAARQVAKWTKEKNQAEECSSWTWEPPAWKGRKPREVSAEIPRKSWGL